MILLVTGGRHYDNRTVVFGALDAVHRAETVDLVIHGGASGADEIAAEWCKRREVWMLTCFASWRLMGDQAGPLRNSLMLSNTFVTKRPDLVLAFPGNKGTANMMRLAKEAGVEVRRIGW